ncbi:MAG: hypothetical protein ACOX0C_01480 [Patescibacteria group bacterium]|jgi:hypothetical protein
MNNLEKITQLTPAQEELEGDKLETETTLEKREILESATKFAEYLVARWPQVETDSEFKGKLNYYLSGSLAVMLLSQAEEFTTVDGAQIPEIVEVQTKKIPESASRILTSFARQLGDLDYVPSKHYQGNPARLRKGGGGPAFTEVPEIGLKALKQEKGQLKIMCDPVETFGEKRVAKIRVAEQDYYISRPDTMLAYKVLHLLQSFEQKPDKFNADFKKILKALQEIYSDKELEKITRQVLIDYENSLNKSPSQGSEKKESSTSYGEKVSELIDKTLALQQISPEIRAILEKLKEEG